MRGRAASCACLSGSRNLRLTINRPCPPVSCWRRPCPQSIGRHAPRLVLCPARLTRASTDTLYPVVYILDGGNYVEKMDVPRILDRLIAQKSIPPIIAVFSEPSDRQEEYSRSPGWRTFVTSELVPLVDKRFRTFPSPDHRVILGSSLGRLWRRRSRD